ncbi:hypothetical protein M407DRAFT_17068 [Tulasnella calospora MUT 4182]|uniref:Uncharacterized protein n=1 Tax=Tulasnella calospora MUT 4182 TaxID=1051891 RepID=A0A0C3MKB4_9AGAM|nr:hypothetical protein M407DRAFT_17068 [Tulasnella calospora MUT 4182]
MVALACDVLKTVAIFGPHGELPDKKTDAEGWNEAWNRYLEWRFHPNPTLNNTSAPNRLLPLFEISDNPLTRKAWLAESKALSTVLLKKQVGMTDFIRDQWGSFALGWLSLGPEERSKHVLRTLIRLCDTFDFERSRFFCPESTTAFLERDSGRGLLDLVTPFAPLPNQTRKRDEPTFLFHPHYDCAMGYDQPCPVGRDPAIWDMIRNNNYCARSEFLCRMLFYIICDALGVEVPPVETRKLWAAKTEGREIYSRLPDSINAVDGFEKEVIGSLQEMQKKAVWIRDWKFGHPPHKTICGKPVAVQSPTPIVPLRAFEQAISSSQKDVYTIPPPDKGFIRSSDLISQIVYLQDKCRELKELAYMKGGEKAWFICLYQDTWTAAYLRVFRNHGFRNGDPKAVAVM